ncbi:uncharacterized protein LOC117122441 [Anneissia japonica]|uniref:uncharacterized protein LOC117122441 n=1 Tax=Anneissia japonica TaxID=1529436 RepID=UPI001425944F|nr:uncharacterized protein LOC117122441 [Anneissia japonica]XP_033123904.1 uncharacterized protein LOC117122441 [Anneissia japonica]
MEFKYVLTPNGLLKIIESVLLVIGFALIVDIIIDIENSKCVRFFNNEICGDGAPWEYFIFAVFAILVAILTLVALVAHLIMPAWMKLIKAKVAKVELVSCVVFAILALVGSACLASAINKDQDEQVAACVLGFIAFALLLVECVFLYRTADSLSL